MGAAPLHPKAKLWHATKDVVSTCLAAVLMSVALAPMSSSAAPANQASEAVESEQVLYLAVWINNYDTETIARFMVSNGQLSASRRDLERLGIDMSYLTQPDDTMVDLDTIPGLRHHYDAAQQSVLFTASDERRLPFVSGVADSDVVQPTADRGMLLNYDAYYEHYRHDHLSLWNELRYFDQRGVLSTTGVWYSGHQTNEYVRFDTSWTHSNVATMRTLRLGDTISSALDWTRPVRMAGIQWSRNFDVRPDLVTFPLPELRGSAVVPSTVDLYINDIRRSSTPVPEGPFVFNQAPGITGAGTATIITRDALGRTTASSLPLYIDRRMLAKGLNAYSIEAGFLRRHYGQKSFKYAAEPALSATARHGWSNAVTFEGHAEATKGLVNVGGGGLFRLGTVGVVNASLAASRASGKGSGTQATVGYQWIQPRMTLDLQTTRRFGNYRDLGSTDDYPMPRRIDRATLAFPLRAGQSVALSYIGYHGDDSTPSRIGSVAYTANLGSRASLSFSTYRDFGPLRDTGFFLGLSVSLGEKTHVSAYGGRQNGITSQNISATRPPDYEGGWGWGAQAGRAGPMHWQQAQADYRGRYGALTAIARRNDHHSSMALNASGALVLMDGKVKAARQINDSFAMVSTHGSKDIPVLHENRRIGTTDRSGYYLIPDLSPYQRNRIAIDALDLPPNAKLTSTTQTVVPSGGAGVLVDFPIQTYRAATVIVHDARGAPWPAGTRVTHTESGAETVVGYDGILFVEDLEELNHLTLDDSERTCTLRFAYEDDKSEQLQTIGPLRCEN